MRWLVSPIAAYCHIFERGLPHDISRIRHLFGGRSRITTSADYLRHSTVDLFVVKDLWHFLLPDMTIKSVIILSYVSVDLQ